MKNNWLTKSPVQTKKLGEVLAADVLKEMRKDVALVLALEGDLGGGKTTFLQGFASGLGLKEKITSPTFVILRKLPIPNDYFKYFYHLDCYRIKEPKELLDLGFKEIISDPKNIVAVEWADNVKKALPQNLLIIKFKFINKVTRKIVIKRCQKKNF